MELRNRKIFPLVLAGAVAFCLACTVGTASRITAMEGQEKIAEGGLLVDVRTPEEFSQGHVAGAINVPHTEIDRRLAEFGDDRRREIVVYCGSGRRAELAQQSLVEHGYKHVFNGGGYRDWVAPPNQHESRSNQR